MDLNEITVGDISQVLKHQWVEVLNKKPVQSGNHEFARGDTGSINVGGEVTVLAVDNEKVLVEYELDHEAYGAPLPSGVIFYLSRKDFLNMKPVRKVSLGLRKK